VDLYALQGFRVFRLLRLVLFFGLLVSGHSLDPQVFTEIIAGINQSKLRDADLARLHFAAPRPPKQGKSAVHPRSVVSSNSSIHFIRPAPVEGRAKQ